MYKVLVGAIVHVSRSQGLLVLVHEETLTKYSAL
jgi:hypothetical protein